VPFGNRLRKRLFLDFSYIFRVNVYKFTRFFRLTGGGPSEHEMSGLDCKIISIIGITNPSISGTVAGFDSMDASEETEAAVNALNDSDSIDDVERPESIVSPPIEASELSYTENVNLNRPKKIKPVIKSEIVSEKETLTNILIKTEIDKMNVEKEKLAAETQKLLAEKEALVEYKNAQTAKKQYYNHMVQKLVMENTVYAQSNGIAFVNSDEADCDQ